LEGRVRSSNEEGKEFDMVKRCVIKPLRGKVEANACSGMVWAGVGSQLRRRRTELGLGSDDVARCVGIPEVSYEGYETGAAIPASVLTQIADLFDIPVIWFFQGIGHDEPKTRGDAGAASSSVYTVATEEYRVQALADSFRKLDLEGQQHLLAISMALSNANAVTK
jgi:transcriptional regulator with XRE-family HTH domain